MRIATPVRVAQRCLIWREGSTRCQGMQSIDFVPHLVFPLNREIASVLSTDRIAHPAFRSRTL
jgi:hypothetical protein